jgi:lysophospholipid acyltransferase (LPLAT)-like uncharacterized protein
MPVKQNYGALSIIETIILAIFIVVLLSNYFQVDLKSEFQSNQTQTAISQAKGGIIGFWNQYLATPVSYLWAAFVSNMKRIHNGLPTDFQLLAPKAPMPY